MSMKTISFNATICIVLYMLAFCLPVHSQSIQDRWLSCRTDSAVEAFEPLVPAHTRLQWTGSSHKGKAHGVGTMQKFIDNKLVSIYEGIYEKGIAMGQGKLAMTDGVVFEGEFQQGQPCGKMTVKFLNGDNYEGRVINYSMHGRGVYYYSDSSRFEGMMMNDKPYSGRHILKNGVIKFLEKGEIVKKASASSFDSSQIGKIITSYLDEDGRIVKLKNAQSIREIILDSFLLPVARVDYFYMNRVRKIEEHLLYLDLGDPALSYRDGAYKAYYANGQLQKECFYRSNQLHGPMKEYDAKGNLVRHSVFSLGVPDGDFVEYYPNGEVKSFAYFEAGQLVEEKFLEYDREGRQSLVRKENFGRHKDFWEHTSPLSNAEVIDTGSLIVKVRQNGSLFRSNVMEVNERSEYSISTLVRKVKGAEAYPYGLIFEFSDWDNYMEFLISDNGSFIVYGKREGMDMFLTDWQPTNFIKPQGEVNHLEVKKIGNNLNYFINGEQVGATRYKGSTGNQVGILAGGKGEYEVNRLIVREYLPAAELSGKRNAPYLVNAK